MAAVTPLSPFFTVEELTVATNNFAADRLVGYGGSAKVFKGVLGSGQIVAVKRWRDDVTLTLKNVEEMMNEVTHLSRVAHANVLPVLGFAFKISALMLVTPYWQRGSLEKVLHDEGGAGLDAAWRLTFVAGLAHGIRALHLAGIVHRDVKGANVLVSDDGVAVLGDAGVARRMRPDVTSTATRVIGTDGYLDPQYTIRGLLDRTADVFSFGVVLLEVGPGRYCSPRRRHAFRTLVSSVERHPTTWRAISVRPNSEVLTGRRANEPTKQPAFLWQQCRHQLGDFDVRVTQTLGWSAACWRAAPAGVAVSFTRLALRASAAEPTTLCPRPTIDELCSNLDELLSLVVVAGAAEGPGGLAADPTNVPPHDTNAADADMDDATHTEYYQPMDAAQEDHRTCIICLVRPRAYRFDCGHMTACEDCVLQLPFQAVSEEHRTAANADRQMRRCPTCRAPTEGLGAPADPHDPTHDAPPQPPPTAAAAPIVVGAEFHALVARMRADPEDAAAQEQACRVLNGYDMNNNAEMQTSAGAAGAVEAVVAAMRAHTLSEGVQRWACVVLSRMTLDNAENQTRAGNAEAVEAAVAALLAHPQIRAAVESALSAITLDNVANQTRAVHSLVAHMRGNLGDEALQTRACRQLRPGNNAEMQAVAAAAGALEVVVAAMIAHPQSEQVLCEALWALHGMIGDGNEDAVNAEKQIRAGFLGSGLGEYKPLRHMTGSSTEIHTLAGAAGAVEAAVAAMLAHPLSDGVQRAACAALYRMTCGNAGNQTRAGNADAVEAVVAAMLAHPRSVRVQQVACVAVSVMSGGNAQIRTRARNAGAVEAVVAAMRAHPRSEELQRLACTALARTAGCYPEDRTSAEHGDAVEAVVEAMSAHPRSRELQRCACLALGAVTRCGGSHERRECAGNAGALEVLVAAMLAYPQSEQVQLNACATLAAVIGIVGENKTRALNAGAVEAVVAAMHAHSRSEELQRCACLALEEMTGCRTENQTRAGREGAVEAVVAAMGAYPQSDGVQWAACKALVYMTRGNKEIQTIVRNAGAVEAVVAAILAHPRSKNVQERAWDALSDMTRRNVENQTHAGNEGALEAVVAAMRAHLRNQGVLHFTFRALSDMTRDNAENQTRAGNADAVEAVVAVMRANLQSQQMQEMACDVLHCMTCDNEESQTRAGNAGAVEAVVAAMRVHPRIATVQFNASEWLVGMIYVNAENRTRAVHAGAVEAINKALTTQVSTTTTDRNDDRSRAATTLSQLLHMLS